MLDGDCAKAPGRSGVEKDTDDVAGLPLGPSGREEERKDGTEVVSHFYPNMWYLNALLTREKINQPLKRPMVSN